MTSSSGTSARPTPRSSACSTCIGVKDLDDLLAQTVPASIRSDHVLQLPPPRSEAEVLAALRQFAARNQARTSLIGMGYTGTFTPPVIQRNVLEDPAWYTAYTPYQAEISQGRLEALLNFQTMVSELTGLPVANASLLDEATAAAEAMAMARRLSKAGSNRFVVHHDTHPQTIAVLATRAEPVGIELVVGDVDEIADGCFGALFSLPTSTGAVVDWREAIERVHAAGAARRRGDRPPRLRADHSPGRRSAPTSPSGRRSASACRWGSAARMPPSSPSRNAPPAPCPGASSASAPTPPGRPALRMALQTREQHIRREKATSNICTAQVLLANIAGFYAAWHGPDGLRRIAERVHRLASIAADAARTAGLQLRHDTWFDTITVDGVDADAVLAAARAVGVDLRRVDATSVGLDVRRDVDARAARARAAGARRLTRPRRRRHVRRTACRRPRGAPASCSPSPCSTATTPSTRCCATCAASPTTTSPSTAR